MYALNHINLLNGTHKRELLYEHVQIKLTIKQNIDVSNISCSRHQNKYNVETFKRLKTKSSYRFLINYVNGKLQ